MNKKFLKNGIIICLVFLIIIALNHYKFAVVNGPSMNPTLKDGDVLVINTAKEPAIGDIVSVRVNYKYNHKGEFVVKRLADINENGEIYLLGDNTENSYDSRKYGYIPGEMLEGVVVYHFEDRFGIFQ